MPLRRLHGLSATASGRLRRGFSTSAWRPPWAMLLHAAAVNVPAPASRASLRLVEPPCASRLVVPAHLVRPPRDPDPPGDTIYAAFGGFIQAASGDGLLLLTFFDLPATAPVVPGAFMPGGLRGRRLTGISLEPEIMRFVCNPLSGQLFRLPDIDGMTKTARYSDIGIVTQSERADHPPDKYAVAVVSMSQDRSFVMRRFLSQTGKWDKVVGLPSPLPLPLARPMDMDVPHEAVAFAGRLWWVDVTYGALSVDPFSDRPELRFVELPRGSVTEQVDRKKRHELRRYRRMSVSDGRMRYAEVSQEEPFLLSSFTLDNDGSCWTLEHRVSLRRLWPREDLHKHMPQIAVVDPLNPSVMHLTVGKQALSLDMDTGDLLGCTLIGEDDHRHTDFDLLKPCVLPPWLESSRIPSSEQNFSIEILHITRLIRNAFEEHGQCQKQEFIRHFSSCRQGQEGLRRSIEWVTWQKQPRCRSGASWAFSAAVSGRLRRGLSTTAAAHPPWATIYHITLVDSPAPRASHQLAAPPCASQILVPAHLVDPPPLLDPNRDTLRLELGGIVRAASDDGLVLLHFMDLHGTAPVVARRGSGTTRALTGVVIEPDITRFVLNPLSGQMVRLTDIDGTKKTMSCSDIGILTQSERPHQPPDRYAVAVLEDDDDGGQQRFVMRRFLSETGKPPSPLPLARRMDINQEAVAFAGRLWWVDVSWGAISADPFSDRPDLRFVELPRDSVTEPLGSAKGGCVTPRCPNRSLSCSARLSLTTAQRLDVGAPAKMRLLLRRSLSAAASASASGRLGRALSTSTAASRPPWAMICDMGELVRSPEPRASFELAEPPCASHLSVPEHLIDPRPRPDPNGDIVPLVGGGVRAASGDGLLLLDFMDARATAPIVGKHGIRWQRQLVGIQLDPDMTRFVCNPVSGQLFRLPDIDGTKKTPSYQVFGILTQSEGTDGPPDKYAVAWLSEDRDGVEGIFLVRRFLSQSGERDKLVGSPSLPLDKCVKLTGLDSLLS
ncbi:hypothetical protein BAE44_0021763 [Dichanthelium oligosanthes]|uniref:DUF1618 domain-containing protein n=1 Tax=Dichanthelium oligosanthes TaxID=888268 RepID=A0A1E5UWK7_9POAL|nr:hypothetical protein BAE44_0021763 [Dichanthelium oligosanthes]